jgi:hypothetical protein
MAPTTVEYLPAAQGVHWLRPAYAAYEPTGHRVQFQLAYAAA